MTTRPKALRLADEIDPLTRYSLDNLTCSAAAAELRRLHNEILVYHDDRLKLSNEVDRLKAAQRQWIGLTPDDIRQLEKENTVGGLDGDYCPTWDLIEAVEAKLKEKNT